MDLRSQGNDLCFQSFLNIYILCPMAFNVCDKKMLFNLIEELMYVTSCFSPAVFKIFPFCLSKH